jgi:hypothetical protein
MLEQPLFSVIVTHFEWPRSCDGDVISEFLSLGPALARSIVTVMNLPSDLAFIGHSLAARFRFQ